LELVLQEDLSIFRIEDQLTDAYYSLSGVTVENLTWDECLMKYDRQDTFMYADPPYWKLSGYGVEFGGNITERWLS
jgi:DNA adenine methylase